MKKQQTTIHDNFFLDITAEVCPLTFVKTKLLIEKMKSDQTATVRLMGPEPLRNVPRSLEELGHTILSLDLEDGDSQGVHILRLRKA